MSAHGFDEKGGGKYTERYVKLLNGTRLIPYDTSHVLTITGTVISDEGTEGVDCFDRTSLSPTSAVDINYIPVQVEVVTLEVSTIAYSLELGGRIHLDTDRGSDTGTHLGTIAKPLKTLSAAMALCASENISTIMLGGTLVLDQDVSGKEFVSHRNAKIDMNEQWCHATSFRNCKLYGTQQQDSMALAYDCRIDNLQNMQGVYESCKFLSTADLVKSTGDIELYDCKGQVAGEYITFDLTNGGNIYVKDHTGNISVKNGSDALIQVQATFNSGMFKAEPTITGGVYVPSGAVRVIDLSAPPAVVVTGGSLATSQDVADLSSNVALIPTNPLLDDDARLADLATQADVELNTRKVKTAINNAT